MITMEMLLDAPSLEGITVLAGHGGMGKEVTAVSVMDAPDSYKWLKGGELILTTGFLLGGDSGHLKHLINNLMEADASGLGIKKERFLDKIPEEIVHIANQHNFPLVEIPHRFVWSDVFSAFYKLFYKISEAASPIESDAIEQAAPDADQEQVYHKFILKLASGKVSKGDAAKFKNSRISQGNLRTSMMIIRASDTNAVFYQLGNILRSPRFCKIGKNVPHFVKSPSEQEAVVMLELLVENNHESPEQWQHMLLEEMEYCMAELAGSYIATGRFYEDIEDIALSLNEARDACTIGRILWEDKRCFSYQPVSTYQVLRKADPSQIDLSGIRLLDHHEKSLSFDSIKTLEAFIECGGYKKAAEKLYIHENTLRYRMQKIGDFLHVNIEDPVVLHTLFIQLKVWELIEKEK